MGIEKDGTAKNLTPAEAAKIIVDGSTEARYQPQIVAWDIKRDVDLAKPENYPGLGDRNLLPKLGLTFDAGYKAAPRKGQYVAPEPPHNFFAIGKRADGLPLEIIEYDRPGGEALKYKQQYLFQYDKLDGGQNRVSVQNWVDSARAPNPGPQLDIGAHKNTLVSVSQYYRNGNDVTKAEFWTADSLTKATTEYENGGTKNAVKHEVKNPDLRIEFKPDTSHVSIAKKGLSGLLGAGIDEQGREAQADLTTLLPKYSFYNLFGPQLPR